MNHVFPGYVDGPLSEMRMVKPIAEEQCLKTDGCVSITCDTKHTFEGQVTCTLRTSASPSEGSDYDHSFLYVCGASTTEAPTLHCSWKRTPGADLEGDTSDFAKIFDEATAKIKCEEVSDLCLGVSCMGSDCILRYAVEDLFEVDGDCVPLSL